MSRRLRGHEINPGTIYCDRDPRDVGCRYRKSTGEYISEGQASTLVLLDGWGLEVRKEEVMTKSTLIIWRTPTGGDSLQFPNKGPARALYEWLNLAKVPFDEITMITVQVKED